MLSTTCHSNPDKITFQVTVDQLTLSTQLAEGDADIRVTVRVGEISKITCSGKLSKDGLTVTWDHPFLFTALSTAYVTISICTLPEELTPTWDKQPMGQNMVTSVANLLDPGCVWGCNVPGFHDDPAILSMTCGVSDVLIASDDHDCMTDLNEYDIRLYHLSRESSNMPSLFTQIELEQALLDLCPEGHQWHVGLLNGIGVCYSLCYDREGNLSDLNRAIEIAEKRLDLCPLGHEEHAKALGELSLHLWKLYQIQGNQADLDRIIEMQQKRLDLCPLGHEDHDTALGNLAASLWDYYRVKGNLTDMNRAIEMEEKRLELCPFGHIDHDEALGNLARSLQTRYQKQGNLTDLNRAIELEEKVLELCPQGHPDHGFSLYNLACSLIQRHGLLKSHSDGLRATNLLKEGLLIYPVQHQRFALVVQSLTFITLQLSSSTEPPASAQPLPEREDAFKVYKLLKTCGPAASLSLWKTTQEWVRDAEKYNHSSLLEAYQTSLNVLDHFTSLHSSIDSRHQVLQAEIAALANDAFSCAVRQGDLQVAIELLEQGRGILWNQLARFDISLATLESRGDRGHELKSRFTQLCTSLKQHAQGSGGSAMEPYWHVREEWQSVVDEIRCEDGFSRFLLPPLFDDLKHAAEHGPVVVVNASEYSCDAIIVLCDRSPVHVSLENYPFEDVVRLCSRFSELVQDPHAYGKNRESWLKSMLRELWDNVVEPIVEVLQNDVQLSRHSRIWWCPASKFTILPFHAAGPHRAKGNQPNLVDLYISSYAPSLSALIRSRERARSQRVAPSGLGAMEKISFATVGQATPHADLELSTLPSVEHELRRICNETNMPLDRVAFETITGTAATIEGAIQAFKDHHWVHLACHGAQHPEKPFESWFAMGDGKLTLMRIVQERFAHSEFAFLSACHTAQGDRLTPDEVLHLAAGMQFAGFNGVIGTLWKVDDAVAHQVVTRFYQKMFEQPVLDFEYAATALDFAVRSSPEVSLEKRIVFAHIGI